MIQFLLRILLWLQEDKIHFEFHKMGQVDGEGWEFFHGNIPHVKKFPLECNNNNYNIQ